MGDKPFVSVVIIGINVQRFIRDCIDSIISMNYPKDRLEIIYVDGGSNDNSSVIVSQFSCVNVVELMSAHPTPGRGRNAGLRLAKGEFVQFLDADSYIHRDWLGKALPYFQENIVAVHGQCDERFPLRNGYHLIGQIEWNGSEGYCKCFGGNVLVRRQPLEDIGGYDEELIAGEEPDLSYRLRQNGWHIYRADAKMVTHDLNMSSFSRYLGRAFRSGHGYAEVCVRYLRNKEKFWLSESLRVVLRCTIPWFILAGSIGVGVPFMGIILALLLVFSPLRKVPSYIRSHKLSFFHSLLYALHLVFVSYPQFGGILRYFYGRVSRKPFRNEGYYGYAGSDDRSYNC